MLSKIHRLNLKSDFERVFRKGTYCAIGNIYLKKFPNKGKNNRFGIIVEKKFFKKSCERNKIKRLLRESIRQKMNHLKSGFDIVIVFRKENNHLAFKEISAIMNKLFQKSNLI